jgi:hypothetical protein
VALPAVPAAPLTQVLTLLPAVRLPADAAQVGLIAVPAPANKLHRKDVTTYQPPVVAVAFIGMLPPVPVVRAAHLQAALLQPQLRPVQQADHVHQVTIG